VEYVQQRLIDRFMVRLGSETILDRATAEWEASSRRRGFHQIDQCRDLPAQPAVRWGPGMFDACQYTTIRIHCKGSQVAMPEKNIRIVAIFSETVPVAGKGVADGNGHAGVFCG